MALLLALCSLLWQRCNRCSNCFYCGAITLKMTSVPVESLVLSISTFIIHQPLPRLSSVLRAASCKCCQKPPGGHCNLAPVSGLRTINLQLTKE